MLIPSALKMIQGDSNREAQAAQAENDRRFSPWLGNNPAGQFNSQTDDAGTISAGLQSYNNSQEEQAREKSQYDRMYELLAPKAQNPKATEASNKANYLDQGNYRAPASNMSAESDNGSMGGMSYARDNGFSSQENSKPQNANKFAMLQNLLNGQGFM